MIPKGILQFCLCNIPETARLFFRRKDRNRERRPDPAGPDARGGLPGRSRDRKVRFPRKLF